MVDFLPSKQAVWVRIPLSAIKYIFLNNIIIEVAKLVYALGLGSNRVIGMGSSPIFDIWGYSLIGRAYALQA